MMPEESSQLGHQAKRTERRKRLTNMLLGTLAVDVLLVALILVFGQAPLALLTIPALVGGYALVTIALDALSHRGTGSQAVSEQPTPYRR
jgi:hypothetical protein